MDNVFADADPELLGKVEIFVSCRKLINMEVFGKSNSLVILFIRDELSKKWVKFNQTEIIQNNLNPNYQTTFLLDYHFEKIQELRFDIANSNEGQKHNYIGSVYTTVGRIFGAKNQTIVDNIVNDKKQPNGKMIIRAEKNDFFTQQVVMQWQLSNIKKTGIFINTCPYIKFYKKTETQDLFLTYQSNVLQGQLNGQLNTATVNIGKLCNGDINFPIKVELWDKNSGCYGDSYLGQLEFNLNNIVNKNQKIFNFVDDQDKAKIVGQLHNISCQITQEPTFMQFIRGGLQLSLIAAIDFTASNLDPNLPESLHSVHQKGQNQYKQALQQVGEILLNYDHDKLVPIFGFGGKPQMQNINQQTVLHCFPLNDNPQNPQVLGLAGMMNAYNQALCNVIQSGPTYFAPLLIEAMKVAQQFQQDQKQNPLDDQYMILLILTDGEIDDMPETTNIIVSCSKLPISIIIVGLGERDFKKMEKLDGDGEQRLCDDQGKMCERDLVQFVPFHQLSNDPIKLSEKVLEELPLQIVQYMELVKRQPNPPQKHPTFSKQISISDDQIYTNNQGTLIKQDDLFKSYNLQDHYQGF